MNIIRISNNRRGAMLTIAVFACFQIVMGIALIMGDDPKPSVQKIYSAQAENIILTSVRADINNDIEWR